MKNTFDTDRKWASARDY